MGRGRPRRGGRRCVAALAATLAFAGWCPPADASPVTIAADYVSSHLSELGITADDLPYAPSAQALPGGVTAVVWRQGVNGVLAADRSLRVNVAADGRVLNLMGSPAHGLDAS